jgi:hypothetical protein
LPQRLTKIGDFGAFWGLQLCYYKEKHYICVDQSNTIMARPIKETPILFGDDARRFEERMKNPPKESAEDRKRRIANYNAAMSMFVK